MNNHAKHNSLFLFSFGFCLLVFLFVCLVGLVSFRFKMEKEINTAFLAHGCCVPISVA
jgi:H+/gluconate symporter-like permease